MADITMQYLIEKIDYLSQNGKSSSITEIIKEHYNVSDYLKISNLISCTLEKGLIFNGSRGKMSYWLVGDNFALTDLGKSYLKPKNQVTIE